MDCTIADVLGDSNKIRMLMALRTHGSLKKTELYRYCSNNSNNSRKLDDLCDWGLVHLAHDRFRNNQTTITLTGKGRDVADLLASANDRMEGVLVETRPGDVGSGPPPEAHVPREA